jgi:hypothetical protein
VGVGSVLTTGSIFGSISLRSLELLLLNVRRNGVLEVMAKSSATFGDIGDGVESPGCMTAVGVTWYVVVVVWVKDEGCFLGYRAIACPCLYRSVESSSYVFAVIG